MGRMQVKPHSAIILIGIPASGKSTFFQNNYADTYVRINLDMLKNRRKEDILIKACLEAKQSFVVDNTNFTRRLRLKYFQLVKEFGLNEFSITAVYFEPDLQRSLEWNNSRDRYVPELVLKSMLSQLEPPSLDEGFDNIILVKR